MPHTIAYMYNNNMLYDNRYIRWKLLQYYEKRTRKHILRIRKTKNNKNSNHMRLFIWKTNNQFSIYHTILNCFQNTRVFTISKHFRLRFEKSFCYCSRYILYFAS